MYTKTELIDILSEYVESIEKFKLYRDSTYPYYALHTELWEFLDKAYIKPVLRGDKKYSEEELKLELGDCFWNLLAFNPRTGHMIDRYAREDKLSPVEVLREVTENKVRYMDHLVFGLLNFYGWDLKEILDMNIDKLEGRLERDTLFGGGDER